MDRMTARGAELAIRGNLCAAFQAEHGRRGCYHWFDTHRECTEYSLGNALGLDGGTIGEYFGDALHDFGGVIAQANDRIGAVFGGMLQQQFEGILASLLA